MKRPEPAPPPGETVYADGRISIRRYRVPLRGGGTKTRAVAVHPGAVVILPILDDGRLVFIRNRRWAIGEVLLELPAGTCDKSGEPLERTAARELAEEAGYTAARWQHLSSLYAAPGGSTEVMHIFLAEGLTEVGQALEPDEEIEVVLLSEEAALERLKAGDFRDMKTVATLGLWQARR